MEIQIGRSYMDRHGYVYAIGGVTTVSPLYVWSYDGYWFEKSTGKYVQYDSTNDAHYVDERNCAMDLVCECAVHPGSSD